MDLIETEPPAWLESEAFAGFRVWQLIFMVTGVILSVVVVLCCCFRFRIPRTKQDIEADFQRKKIAKKFRERLAFIQNSEMDEMDLKKALERVRAEFKLEEQQLLMECGKMSKNNSDGVLPNGDMLDAYSDTTAVRV